MQTLAQSQNKVKISQKVINEVFAEKTLNDVSNDQNFIQIMQTSFHNPQKTDYKAYLDHSLDVLKKKTTEGTNINLDIDSETLMEEIPVWKLNNFVWPFLLHNNEGGIVLLWSMNGRILRLERLREGLYTGEMFSKNAVLDGVEKQHLNAPKFVKEFLRVYSELNQLAYERKIDWRNKLVGQLANL